MRVQICGVEIDNCGMQEAVDRAMQEREGVCRVVTPNATMLQACREDKELQILLTGADLVLPDGAGVLWAAKLQKTPLRERIAGIDFGEALLRAAAEAGDTVFLLGGKEGIAKAAAERLQERIPKLRICGTHSGYFEKSGEENRAVLDLICEQNPKILLVCFGFPLQERWMAENLAALPCVKIAAGLGGSLDVWSGTQRRAPRAMQKCGLEWAWRMVCNPKKLRQVPVLTHFLLDQLKRRAKSCGKMHT